MNGEYTGPNEPILVYLSDPEFVAAFERPKITFPKALEHCAFPPLLQQLVKLLKFFSS
jgi:hypothetical protein